MRRLPPGGPVPGAGDGRLGREAPALSGPALAALEFYDWPDKVRELRNALEQALVMKCGGVIGSGDLPDSVVRAGGGVVELDAGSAREILRCGRRDGFPVTRHLSRDPRSHPAPGMRVGCHRSGGSDYRNAAEMLGLARRACTDKLGLRHLLARSAGSG